MNTLNSVCNRITDMVNDYNARVDASAKRIVTLGEDLQTAKEAMNAAADADDLAAYQEAESRVHFITARIEAAKREQVAPLFSSPEEAKALDAEYKAAINEAIRPVYAQMDAAMKQLQSSLAQLREIRNTASPSFYKINGHMKKAGYYATPFEVSTSLAKYVEENVYHAHNALNEVLNK